MRVRKLSAAAAAVTLALAVSGLTACDTKVGQAAIVDGHRISESQVAKYLTAKAAAVSVQTQGGGTAALAPRAYVLHVLIAVRLYDRVLTSAHSRPSEGALAQVTTRALNGATPTQVTEKSGVHGYTAEFDRLWVRVQILAQTLQNAAQNGVDLKTLIDKLQFPVTVNPRYGTWDKKILDLSTDAGAGIPDFLKLEGVSPAAPQSTAVPTN